MTSENVAEYEVGEAAATAPAKAVDGQLIDELVSRAREPAGKRIEKVPYGGPGPELFGPGGPCRPCAGTGGCGAQRHLVLGVQLVGVQPCELGFRRLGGGSASAGDSFGTFCPA
ncbi:hypothetical protein GCM10010238_61630 [Streptomyces griseoviridis]|uniref:Uncharacterized protein n=1 Tax=Streptomyces griseoviridis TaxID=45398 RepID=A0A918GUL8_STRGD|nr:hypothetical protein GCM10010238_61630 [Streptomyces niveoruber]